jgi:hypothetical protein
MSERGGQLLEVAGPQIAELLRLATGDVRGLLCRP